MVVFKEILGTDCEDENSGYFIGLAYDFVYEISYCDHLIGQIYFSEYSDDSIYIQWVQIDNSVRNQGLLRRIIETTKSIFPSKTKIECQSSKEHIEKYKHLGFSVVLYDELRSMYEIELSYENEKESTI